MAYQDDRLSTTLIDGEFRSPDDLASTALIDYELGGIELNDPTAGMQVQVWTATYDSFTGNLSLSAPSRGSSVLWTRSNITEISLAFDQNMNPFIAFVESGVAKYYWWDTDIPGFAFTNLDVGAVSPRACLDDKRETQTNSSDIILGYVLSGALYMRKQRERFLTPHLQIDPFVDDNGNGLTLEKVGMNEYNRLQYLGRVGSS